MSSQQSVSVTLKPGDVVRYVPKQHHCREATAIVMDDGRLLDTFWGGFNTGYGDRHGLTPDERATVEVKFNVNDFELLSAYPRGFEVEKWKTYRPEDRGRVPSQHGLQAELYVRKGATPDLDTQIANAQAAVEQAAVDLRSAEHKLKWRREDLAKLVAKTGKERPS